MAMKSGRVIKADQPFDAKKLVLSWEGALVVLFIALNIFNKSFKERRKFSR